MSGPGLVTIAEVCQQDRRTIRPGERPDLPYVGLETIESQTGRFVDGDLSKTPETPQANSFLFSQSHVLYGKLRPYLNKVALPDFEGKCSTELVPLLPGEALDRSYLAYFLRSENTVRLISERTAGARMPRTDMDFLFSLQIPLRPLSEQRRIADILARAEGIVRLQRQSAVKASEIVPALFLNMFGDPATNPEGWPTDGLGDLVTITSRVQIPPASDASLLCIGPDSIESRTGRVLSLPTVGEARPRSGKYRFATGQVLYSKIRPALAKATLAATPGYCSADMYALTVGKRLTSQFLLWLILSRAFTEWAVSRSARAQMPKINRETLLSYRAPVPPMQLQQRFSTLSDELTGLLVSRSHALVQGGDVFSALIHRAFPGQPT